jgi:Ca2+-binding EF-hand superfamily protein
MVVMAKSISKMTGVYLRHKAKATEQEYFNRKLTENDFELMDVEGEGHVGYDEFLVFMLVAMGKVNPEDIQKMEELYQRLDAENEGAIKIEDLFTLAYGDIKDS